MKILAFCAILCLTITPGMGAAMQSSSAESSLRALIAAQQSAWNHSDSVAWSATFSPTASFINIRGDEVHGRTGIEALHRFILSGAFKGSQNTITVQAILFPAPNVAIVETTHEVVQFASLPPGVVASAPGVLRTHMKYIATLDNGMWAFIAAQNTAVLPMPLGFKPPTQ